MRRDDEAEAHLVGVGCESRVCVCAVVRSVLICMLGGCRMVSLLAKGVLHASYTACSRLRLAIPFCTCTSPQRTHHLLTCVLDVLLYSMCLMRKALVLRCVIHE